MDYLIIGGLLAAVAIVGSGMVLGRKLPGPLQFLSRTGLGFLLLGMLFGPMAFDVFDTRTAVLELTDGTRVEGRLITEGDATVAPVLVLETDEGVQRIERTRIKHSAFGATLRQTLEPITALALAWIGMLYGTHLEFKRLRRFPAARYVVTWLQSGLALVLVALSVWTVLGWIGPDDPGPGYDMARLVAALFCGAAAGGTAPAGLFMLREEARMSGPIYERLLFFSTLDDLPGLAVLVACFALVRPAEAASVLPLWGWLLLSVVAGVLLAMLLRMVMRPDLDDEHVFLVLLGMLGMSSGVCEVLHLAPLGVGVLAGAIFANRSGEKERVYKVLANREHTLYVLFLVLAGTLVDASAWVVWPVVAAIVLSRLFGKIAGASVLRLVGNREALPLRAGFALIPQGGMAVAMAASFAHAYPSPLTQTVVAATVVAVLVSDLVGAELAPFVLRGVRD
jgi:Kef-type K+ transport system membrane component KefB